MPDLGELVDSCRSLTLLSDETTTAGNNGSLTMSPDVVFVSVDSKRGRRRWRSNKEGYLKSRRSSSTWRSRSRHDRGGASFRTKENESNEYSTDEDDYEQTTDCQRLRVRRHRRRLHSINRWWICTECMQKSRRWSYNIIYVFKFTMFGINFINEAYNLRVHFIY